MDNEDQKALLEALQKGDKSVIDQLASKLFFTQSGGCNWVEMDAFEKYAPCTIVCLKRDKYGWLEGGIVYNGHTYRFG